MPFFISLYCIDDAMEGKTMKYKYLLFSYFYLLLFFIFYKKNKKNPAIHNTIQDAVQFGPLNDLGYDIDF